MGGLGDLERIDYARLRPGAYTTLDATARVQEYRSVLDGFVRANHDEVITIEPVSVSGELMTFIRYGRPTGRRSRLRRTATATARSTS